MRSSSSKITSITKDPSRVSTSTSYVRVIISTAGGITWCNELARPRRIMTEPVSLGTTRSSTSCSSKRDISPTAFRKCCTLCQTPRSVLVRCQIDETAKWHFVCTGNCWKSVSGGTVDAAGHKDEFPYYRYGGMWKNKHEGVSAKKKRKGKSTTVVDKNDREEGTRVAVEEWKLDVEYTRNDLVKMATNGAVWMCRRSHRSEELNGPLSRKGYRWWKEDDHRVAAEIEGRPSKNEIMTDVSASGSG